MYQYGTRSISAATTTAIGWAAPRKRSNTERSTCTCHTVNTIAAAHTTPGVRVGRASHRLRNPANAPPAWVAPLLEAYVADPASRAPREVALPGGGSGYVEPIYVQPLCVTCHGKAIAPDVAARIDALYPEDQATGFDVDDLRGVWWVETKAAP